MYHYTDQSGYNAIRAQRVWHFQAAQPPGGHPFGAYFTTLGPTAPRLAARLRIPVAKLAFLFHFTGREGLQPLEGGRGAYILYSPSDYDVPPERQRGAGPRPSAGGRA